MWKVTLILLGQVFGSRLLIWLSWVKVSGTVLVARYTYVLLSQKVGYGIFGCPWTVFWCFTRPENEERVSERLVLISQDGILTPRSDVIEGGL